MMVKLLCHSVVKHMWLLVEFAGTMPRAGVDRVSQIGLRKNPVMDPLR